jgi:hypothetical protein
MEDCWKIGNQIDKNKVRGSNCEMKIVGGPVVRVWDQRFAPSMVSGSSPVVAHMMATGGLHGR